MAIDITILQTGTIRIRPSHQHQSAKRPVPLRIARMFVDRRWTSPLPINTYLIDHPEGRILFDTGESPEAVSRRFFPWWQPFFMLSIDIDIERSESIGALLARRGLTSADLRCVVVSHLHHDHGDGLRDLPDTTIYTSPDHWEAFRSPFKAVMQGGVPSHWPSGFRPTLLEPTGGPIGPFERSYPLTSDGTISAVDLPGHLPGMIGLLIRDGDLTYFLVSDATYDQGLLDCEVTDGVNTRPHVAIESMRKIKEFARSTPTVVLPAHDLAAARRLANREVYLPTPRP